MRHRITATIMAVALAGTLAPGPAAAAMLPDEIAEPYVAYEQAMQAHDYETAYDAARRAWRAAEQLNYDLETTVLLADNYAQLARARGAFGEAVDAYERAGEILESIGADPILVAETWTLAGAAALDAADTGEALRYADRAGDLVEGLSGVDPAARANQLFSARAIHAHALWRQGRVRQAGTRAAEALDALGGHGLTAESPYATLAFYRGASAAMLERGSEAAYWLSIAYTLKKREDPDSEMVRGLKLWADYARDQLASEDRLQLLRQLAEEGMIMPDDDDGGPPADTSESAEAAGDYAPEDADNRDAQPLRRRPPRYPEDAIHAHLEGVAVIEFAVNEEGRVEDAEVVFSIPYADFGEAALSAVERWRYEPKLVDGEPVRREGVVTGFQFAMEE